MVFGFYVLRRLYWMQKKSHEEISGDAKDEDERAAEIYWWTAHGLKRVVKRREGGGLLR